MRFPFLSSHSAVPSGRVANRRNGGERRPKGTAPLATLVHSLFTPSAVHHSFSSRSEPTEPEKRGIKLGLRGTDNKISITRSKNQKSSDRSASVSRVSRSLLPPLPLSARGSVVHPSLTHLSPPSAHGRNGVRREGVEVRG